MHIQNQFNFTQYKIQYSVQWQFGNSVLMLLQLPGNFVVLLVWLTDIYSVKDGLVALHTITPVLHKCSDTYHRDLGDASKKCVSDSN